MGISAARGRANRIIAMTAALAAVLAGATLLGGSTDARALEPEDTTPGIAGPAQTGPAVAPLAASPFDWELPEGVERVEQTLFRVDDAGNVIGQGPVAPGRTFFYAFRLQNTGEQPVTVTGFESNFTIVMHPDRQGDYPADHCLQFFETRDFGERQTYPQVIEPGDTVTLGDNATYHYIRGPVSNECQQAAFFFGPPSFQTAEAVSPEQPVWREATCDVPAAVTIPETRGVEYAIDGVPATAGEHEAAAGRSVTVTAAPAEGFEFPEETVSEWTHAFSEPDCDDGTEAAQEGDQDAGGTGTEGNAGAGGSADADPNAGADSGGAAGGSASAAASADAAAQATTPVAVNSERRLADTGASASAPLWFGGALAALIGAAMLLRSRRTAQR